MKFDFAIPSSVLQPYIKQYWAIENILGRGEEYSQRIIATGLPELIFYFGKVPKSDKRNIEGNVLLNGQHNDFYDLLVTDSISMFSVTFQPDGLSHFLKMPISEFKNQTICAKSFNKAFFEPLEEELAEAEIFYKRVEIVERFFYKLLAGNDNSIDHRRIAKVVDIIKLNKGKVPIDSLASSACLSRKQFERKFIAQIGISPKQFLKIIRFQNAIHLTRDLKNLSLTGLAYEAGYYDQSHFINETVELTGQTPKKLFESGELVSDFFC